MGDDRACCENRLGIHDPVQDSMLPPRGYKYPRVITVEFDAAPMRLPVLTSSVRSHIAEHLFVLPPECFQFAVKVCALRDRMVMRPRTAVRRNCDLGDPIGARVFAWRGWVLQHERVAYSRFYVSQWILRSLGATEVRANIYYSTIIGL